jgi:hypothetical protein
MKNKIEYNTKSLLAATKALLAPGRMTVIHCGVCSNNGTLTNGSECKACEEIKEK